MGQKQRRKAEFHFLKMLKVFKKGLVPETSEVYKWEKLSIKRQWTDQKTDSIMKFLGGINRKKKKDVKEEFREDCIKFNIEGSMELNCH